MYGERRRSPPGWMTVPWTMEATVTANDATRSAHTRPASPFRAPAPSAASDSAMAGMGCDHGAASIRLKARFRVLAPPQPRPPPAAAGGHVWAAGPGDEVHVEGLLVNDLGGRVAVRVVVRVGQSRRDQRSLQDGL